MKIKVEVNTTKKDYMSFHVKNAYRSAWIYILLVALVAVLAVLNIRYANRTGGIDDSLFIMLAMACAMLVYIIINNVVKIIKAAKKEEAKPVFEYTFTKGGMHCDSSGRSFDLQWKDVYKVTEYKNMFLVYINKNSAFILPKSSFKSESDIELFSQTLLFKPVKKKSKKGDLNNGKRK